MQILVAYIIDVAFLSRTYNDLLLKREHNQMHGTLNFFLKKHEFELKAEHSSSSLPICAPRTLNALQCPEMFCSH